MSLSDAPRRLRPTTLAVYGALLGAGMVALAWLWAVVLFGRDPRAWFPADRWFADVAVGAGLGVAFALAMWAGTDRIPAFRRIERLLLRSLEMDALRYCHALLFGLIAGIPEEILFRGALQPTLGIVVTALAFGALHAITPAYFVYATGAGFLLGISASWSGGLWMPAAAHVMVDLTMFSLLIGRWRRRYAC